MQTVVQTVSAPDAIQLSARFPIMAARIDNQSSQYYLVLGEAPAIIPPHTTGIIVPLLGQGTVNVVQSDPIGITSPAASGTVQVIAYSDALPASPGSPIGIVTSGWIAWTVHGGVAGSTVNIMTDGAFPLTHSFKQVLISALPTNTGNVRISANTTAIETLNGWLLVPPGAGVQPAALSLSATGLGADGLFLTVVVANEGVMVAGVF